jgi:hypothetical protein
MKTFNKITFKHEGEINGEPFGPVVLMFADGKEQRLERWMTLSQARALASQNGSELDEF